MPMGAGGDDDDDVSPITSLDGVDGVDGAGGMGDPPVRSRKGPLEEEEQGKARLYDIYHRHAAPPSALTARWDSSPPLFIDSRGGLTARWDSTGPSWAVGLLGALQEEEQEDDLRLSVLRRALRGCVNRNTTGNLGHRLAIWRFTLAMEGPNPNPN